MQLNSTYHGATKAIPYEVVFNRKPNYKRVPIGMRQIDPNEIEDQAIENEDEEDNSHIPESNDQEVMQLEAPIWAHDEDYQEFVTHRLNADSERILEEEATQEREVPESDTAGPSTPPNRTPEKGFAVDPDLLSPHLDRLQLAQRESEQPQELDSTPTTALRQRVQINQKHANERSQRQYGKQRQITTFALFDQVSVAVPALDRASTDDKRIFGKVVGLFPEYNSYQIMTKYGFLDRNYPVSELNPLPSEIDIRIPEPMPQATVTLHYCAAQESTTKKVPVHCNCRNLKMWCSTRRCACVKAEAKCSIACHGGTDQDDTPDCPNISSMRMRTQRGHRVRDGVKEAKRQRRDRAGSWITSKGNDLVDTGATRK